MEKKYFFIIPLFFLLFSFLFPFSGGLDRYFVKDTASQADIQAASPEAAVPPFPGRECTCFIGDSTFSAAGFLDGTVLISENNSACKALDNRTSGKFQTVYSIAASEGAEYLAILSGIYPKSLSVYQKKQNGYTLIHRTELQHDVRKSTYMAFSGNILLYEDTEGITALSLTNLKQFSLAFDGALKRVDLSREQEYVWVYSKDDAGKDFVHIFLYDGSLVASAPNMGDNPLMAKLVEQ